MGRKPIPTSLKLLKGNPGKRPINQDEPKPECEIPEIPKFLNTEGKKEWIRISQELYNLGLLSNIDKAALSVYCQVYGRWVMAEKALKKDGLTIVTAQGNVIQNPLLGIANRAMIEMRKTLIEFGMTPASRSRVSAQPKEKTDSKWGKISGNNG